MTGDEVLLIVGMALVTFMVRYPVLALLGRLPLPDAVFRALRYVPPAGLPAIIIPAITLDRRGTLLSIVIGMAALRVLKQFLAG